MRWMWAWLQSSPGWHWSRLQRLCCRTRSRGLAARRRTCGDGRAPGGRRTERGLSQIACCLEKFSVTLKIKKTFLVFPFDFTCQGCLVFFRQHSAKCRDQLKSETAVFITYFSAQNTRSALCVEGSAAPHYCRLLLESRDGTTCFRDAIQQVSGCLLHFTAGSIIHPCVSIHKKTKKIAAEDTTYYIEE